MNENLKRLKQIDTENFVWIIYLFIIGLCIYGNYYEKRYFLYNDIKAKNKYREITIFIFTVAVVIYTYFFIDNYQDFKSINPYESKKKKDLTTLSLIGTALVLFSGIIFLYIAIVDTDINIEIAFN